MDNKASKHEKTLVVMELDQLIKIIYDVMDDVLVKRGPDIIREANEKEYLTGSEVRAKLGFSVRSLQHIRDSRQISFMKHGRKIVYSRLGVEKFLQEHHILPRENERGVKP
jgi:hypothetical protein